MPGLRAARSARSGSSVTPRPAVTRAWAATKSSVVNATRGAKPADAHCCSRCARQRSHPAIHRCSDSRARSAGHSSVTAGASGGSPPHTAVSGMMRCTASDSSTCSRSSSRSAACPGSDGRLPSAASCRKISATSTYPARSIRSASGGSASVSRRSTLGCRSCRIAAAAGTSVPSAEGKAASRSRPARSPEKTASSFSAASRRPITSTARSASSRPASVSRMPRPARCTSLVPVSASSRARWWLTDGWA